MRAWHRPAFAALMVALLGLVGGAAYAALAASAGSGPRRPRITAGPSKLMNKASAGFAYSSKGAVAFLCSLDGSAFTPCGTGTIGSTVYAGLSDGQHSFQVEAQAGSSTSDPTTRTWTIDTQPPPLPVFTRTPADSTTDTKARFAYRDAEYGVAFRCRLDVKPSTRCQSHATYKKLSLGAHGFCVRALDRAGNSGQVACSTWLIRPGEARFSIAGSPLPGALLYPRGPAVPVDLVFTNPNPAPITVQSVIVSVAGTSGPGCAAGAFTVMQQLTAKPTVPAVSTMSLQDLGVAQSEWPQLLMVDTGDQDACQNATVALAYSGTATG